jgi:hypothetical protein
MRRWCVAVLVALVTLGVAPAEAAITPLPTGTDVDYSSAGPAACRSGSGSSYAVTWR